MRKQFLESTGRLRRQSLKHVLEIAIRIMSIELGGLDEAHDVGGALSGTKGSGKEPVRSAQGHGPDSVLDVIVVDRQIAIVEVASQRRPATEAVVDRFSCGGPVRHLAALSSEPLPQGFRDGF